MILCCTDAKLKGNKRPKPIGTTIARSRYNETLLEMVIDRYNTSVYMHTSLHHSVVVTNGTTVVDHMVGQLKVLMTK